MNEAIKHKIEELYAATPENIGVGYGKKKVGGQYTEEISIVFLVEKKKPLDQLSPEEVLPSSVEIDGVVYKTDVREVGKIKLMECDASTLSNCYGWQSIYPGNQNWMRPIMGGIQIASGNMIPFIGTLGFIAVDTVSQALVGVTNSHVVILNPFYTSHRAYDDLTDNEEDDTVYQNYWGVGNEIGKIIRYAPLRLYPYTNTVDGALIGLTSSVISFTESFKQYGLSYTLPMAFATTSEINNLVTTDPPIYSSGVRTGAKEGTPCGLKISAIGVSIPAGPYRNGVHGGVEQDTNVAFSNLIEYTRINPDCLYPIASGDSGSALIANFSGVWKIIGLCFAGNAYDDTAYACRIDEVASQLGISAWDGSAKNFLDLENPSIVTQVGTSGSRTISCHGDTYWQIGSKYYQNLCT